MTRQAQSAPHEQEFAALFAQLPQHDRRAISPGCVKDVSLLKDLVDLAAEARRLDTELAGLDAGIWFTASGNPALTKNDCSRLHKLKEAAENQQLLDKDKLPQRISLAAQLEHTFVVKHDWRAALEGAASDNDSWRLPYPLCCFELRINERTILLCAEETSGENKIAACFMPWKDRDVEYWLALPMEDELATRITRFVWEQIRAICIALDAEVATSEVVRAPVALNEKRTKRGKPPLSDYRVVDLARRHRVANPNAGHTGGKKRLHFRRGHWRHYEASKTWIRWCLVGDPDLGFIAKHYAL